MIRVKPISATSDGLPVDKSIHGFKSMEMYIMDGDHYSYAYSKRCCSSADITLVLADDVTDQELVVLSTLASTCAGAAQASFPSVKFQSD